ncbi:MAG: hypothetical protein ACXWV7_08750, partial [Nitrospira sp.]
MTTAPAPEQGRMCKCVPVPGWRTPWNHQPARLVGWPIKKGRQQPLGKRLRCRKVEVLAKSERGTIYVLEIGHTVELDWSWEGAIAFRPLVMDDQAEKQPLFNDQQDDPEIDDSILWQGEIVEVGRRGLENHGTPTGRGSLPV